MSKGRVQRPLHSCGYAGPGLEGSHCLHQLGSSRGLPCLIIVQPDAPRS